jgi:hypothetical protein
VGDGHNVQHAMFIALCCVFGLSRLSLKARALITITTPSLPHPPSMIFAKTSLVFAVVSFAAFFCAESAEAARGPKITSKVYFDIQHGDQPMGRSAFTSLSRPCLSNPGLMNLTVVLGLYGGVRCVRLFCVSRLNRRCSIDGTQNRGELPCSGYWRQG